ncbi:MAG: anaerobic ribonucleoside-triphosphate reductase activating protein [Oscillospiraceae bacterium]|nr:anaerobic ribonucleoside-triphosphate reductase activating protein [Oscillospiraceae bacterium]
MRLFGVAKESVVDGPGLRFAVFVQGCPLNCPGCHNPESRDFSGGYEADTDGLLEQFDKNPLLRGLTLSGGEPFSQAAALIPPAKEIKKRGKDIWCYSGYEFEELLEMAKSDSNIRGLLELLDVLVDGPFILSRKDISLPYRGSKNQRLLDVPRSLEAAAAVLFQL